MKILVFGKSGQVAQELQKKATDLSALSRAQADLGDPSACAAVIKKTDADVIINAAAYTNVDGAEQNHELAHIVNAVSPTEMAKAAAARAIPFLHISSDYVFGGAGDHAQSLQDKPAPINTYGKSKLAGEQGIAAAGGVYAILRTSWVFSAYGNNFVKTMLRLGAARQALSVVEDQIGGPTAAADIAAALLTMAGQLDAEKSGVYHYSGAPDISWLGFATEIFRQANMEVSLSGIPTSSYPTPAARPLNSRLECRLIESVFGIAQPEWRRALATVLQDIGEQ